MYTCNTSILKVSILAFASKLFFRERKWLASESMTIEIYIFSYYHVPLGSPYDLNCVLGEIRLHHSVNTDTVHHV